MSFDNFLKKELNPDQRKAVKHKNGALLVIAGAGSGKTRVITSRITHLVIKEQVDPKSIIALTFTNKAAGEMKERIAKFLQTDSILPFVGTFHSYCLLLLRRNPKLAPFENFTIFDDDDQRALVKKIIKRHGLEKQTDTPKALANISHLKNKLFFNPHEKQLIKPIFRDIYTAYETERVAAHSLDFDDLLLETLKIFSKNIEFREKFQDTIRHILVDEYQDTNRIQHELLKHMSLNIQNKLAVDSICAVGDEDQSIYSWRGAVVENMIKFGDDFKPIKKIKIEQNYRSVKPILEAANKVIKVNTIRNKKNLWSTRDGKNRILSLACRSEYQEADAVSLFIETMQKKQSIAILYRTHFQSRVLEEALTSKGIAYKIIGGIQFYQRREIKDILAYLKLIANPYDRVSFFRVLNTPTRGIGDVFENLIVDYWEQHPELNSLEIIEKILDEKPQGMTKKRIDALSDFINIFYGLDKNKKTSFLIKIILDKTDYINYLKNSLDAREADMKIENIRELQQSISYYENNLSTDYLEKTLENFLHDIALMQEKAENQTDDSECVQLMTLHAVKGLEFDAIIIAGLEDGLFPSSRSLNSYEALEEERRLFYVGMTRAKERLVLSHSYCRNKFGQLTEQVISRFLEEVPSTLLQGINVVTTNQWQLKQMFSQWLGSKNQTQETVLFGASSLAKNKPKKKVLSRNNLDKKIQKLYGSAPRLKKSWSKNRPVVHKKFGVGVIKQVEKKGDGKYHVTVTFKSGEKKLLSNFLELV